MVLFLGLAVELFHGLPLSLVYIIILSIFYPSDGALIGAFSIGVVLDILFGWPLGYHALFFLGGSFFILLYKRRFQATSAGFLVFSTLLFSALYFHLFFRHIPAKDITIILFCVLLVSHVVKGKKHYALGKSI